MPKFVSFHFLFYKVMFRIEYYNYLTIYTDVALPFEMHLDFKALP